MKGKYQKALIEWGAVYERISYARFESKHKAISDSVLRTNRAGR